MRRFAMLSHASLGQRRWLQTEETVLPLETISYTRAGAIRKEVACMLVLKMYQPSMLKNGMSLHCLDLALGAIWGRLGALAHAIKLLKGSFGG